MKKVLFILCQCTWGMIQTVLGFIIFLYHVKHSHLYFHGAVVTLWKKDAGLSLGLFIFLPANSPTPRLLRHEYGHAIQSLIFGPLYLIVMGLPSLLWFHLPWCQKYRQTQNISYYEFYTERLADYLGEFFIPLTL